MDGRVTYVIDRKGTVRHIFRDLLNGPEHIKEAIRVLKYYGFSFFLIYEENGNAGY